MISIWEQQTYYADREVFIAGAGLLGLWTAYELLLKEPSLTITIADQLLIPAMASTRNAGFACFGSPSELWSDARCQSEDTLWEIAELRYQGIQKIRKICGDEAIEYDPCGGYEVFRAGTEWQQKEGRERIAWLNKGFEKITGIKETYTDCSDQMAEMGLSDFGVMYGNQIEGGLHSGKLVKWLQEYLQKAGVQFLWGHRVKSVSGKQGHFEIGLETLEQEKQTLKSRQMLWATNAALSLLPEIAETVKPARGQMLLSPEIPGFSLRGTFHFDEGYYYFRNLGNRLLIGGARNADFEAEETLDAGVSPKIREALERFIALHLPEAAASLKQNGWMHWSGIMGMSDVKKPMIIQMDSGGLAGMACNGMGVALTPAWAETLSSAMLLQIR